MPTRGESKVVGWNAVYYDGVFRRRKQGLNFIGLTFLLAVPALDELEQLADVADEYGDGTIRTTMSQNIILAGIPDDKVEAALQAPVLHRLSPNAKPFMSRTVSLRVTSSATWPLLRLKNAPPCCGILGRTH